MTSRSSKYYETEYFLRRCVVQRTWTIGLRLNRLPRAMERGPSTIFFSYPQNDSHSVGIHQQSSNKSNCAREFPVLAMDGNSISFTQFRAFASGGAIDSTGVQIVSRCFQRFLDGANGRHARIVTRSPPTRNQRNVSSRRTGCRIRSQSSETRTVLWRFAALVK